MKPRVTVLTIGVDDLDRAIRFYRDGLGLHTDGIVGADLEFGAVAFFPLQSGLQLALWPRKSIAHDCGLDVTALGGRVESSAAAAGLTHKMSRAPLELRGSSELPWRTIVVYDGAMTQ